MKALKWTGIVIALLFVAGSIFWKVAQHNTKKHSPEETIEYSIDGEVAVEIVYSRPYMKGREIMGGLVPYGQVWRTGANEPVMFTTNRDIQIAGQDLKAGEYTFWTIPNEDSWELILNSELYGWGVNFSNEASREAEHDVLNVIVPREEISPAIEQFTIAISDDMTLSLSWENTQVSVPMSLK